MTVVVDLPPVPRPPVPPVPPPPAAPDGRATPVAGTGGRRPSWRGVGGTLVVVAAGVLVTLPDDLAPSARLALFGFVLATVLWTSSPLSPAYVALVAAAVVTVPAGDQELLLASLGHDVVWLVVGAFVLGGALQATGLAERLVRAVVGRARTVGGVAWLLTAALLPLAFVVPSTSGRAAVMLPVHRGLSHHLGSPRASRMLAVLIPSVVLVSTTATLVGATSHLVAVDLLEQATGDTISFLQWAVWGVPFALAASAVTCLVVLRQSLTAAERERPVTGLSVGGGLWSRDERVAGAVLGTSLVAWLSEPLHGVGIATVTLVAALVLTAPVVGVTTWQEGLRHVSWSVVLFVAGALVLGQALVDTGAGAWLVDRLIGLSRLHELTSPIALVLVLAVLAVTTHLYVTSHTVRAVTIVPPLLAATAPLDLSPVAVVFLVTIGLDYCLTMPVSSKALLVFAEADDDARGGGEGLRPSDLVRLSAVLMPAFVALMVVTYVVWWQWTGLAL